jgi:hypothetical protein
MIKRLIWFLVGAAVAAFVIKKVRDYFRRATPEAIGQRLATQAGGLGESAAGFIDRARAAMAEREAELREALGQPQPTDENPER